MSAMDKPRHPVEDCEACQTNILLYGVSYLDTTDGRHIDPPDLLIIGGPLNQNLRDSPLGKLHIGP